TAVWSDVEDPAQERLALVAVPKPVAGRGEPSVPTRSASHPAGHCIWTPRWWTGRSAGSGGRRGARGGRRAGRGGRRGAGPALAPLDNLDRLDRMGHGRCALGGP